MVLEATEPYAEGYALGFVIWKKGRSQEARTGTLGVTGGTRIALATKFSMPTLMSVQVSGIVPVAPEDGTLIFHIPVPAERTNCPLVTGENASPPESRKIPPLF